VNEQLWVLFRENKINKREMREGRFEKTFMVYGTPMPGIGETINESYLKEMPLQLKLVDGAQEVLDYVYGKYKVSIITNGFVESQISKIEQSGIKKYFDNVFISESIGVQKPDSLIFEHAIHSYRAPKKSSLMIGDSWETDIIGAMRMGIDQIFYQPSLLSFFADAKIVEFEPGMIEGYFEPSKERYSSHKNSTRLIFNLKQLIEIL
jgi:putative hydrolase of the HAD superfamily